MTSLYVTSIEAAAGKSAICAGIGKRLLEDGRRVGFLKPVVITGQPGSGEAVDEDVLFIKQVLALEEPADSLCIPVATAALAAKEQSETQKIQKAYEEVSAGRDIVIVEGLSGVIADRNRALASAEMVRLFGAKTLMVIRHDTSIEDIVTAAKTFQQDLLGVVINAVPPRRMELARTSLAPFLEERGIRVLGILPEDRLLFSASVSEVAEHLHGEVLNCPERLGELVENVMAGAMCVDSGLEYFSRKSNKAVITRGDRADIQLAALETSTKCLVLSGNMRPIPNILYRAEEQGVPIIVVGTDTLSTAAAFGEVFGKARFHHEKKLERLKEILAEHFDSHTLYRGLGIEG